LRQATGKSLFLCLGPEDCEPPVEPEEFGKGGVEVESEYDLELRIGDNVGRPGMGHPSLLTVPNKTVRWRDGQRRRRRVSKAALTMNLDAMVAIMSEALDVS
jgi:hypothetical protein